MQKDKLLKLLKNVIDILEKNNITYEIPYVHILKHEFNHIKIIISDEYNHSDLINIFESCKNNVTKDYTKIIYNDIDVIFIFANKEIFNYTFYYYCWDMMSVLINYYANEMGMNYNDNGLFYNNNLISTNLQKILLFFDLNKNAYVKGFFDPSLIFGYITMSSYFNPHIYSLEKFKKLDIFYEYNKTHYVNFLEYIKIFKNYEGYKFKNDYSKEIKDYFIDDPVKKEQDILKIIKQNKIDPDNILYKEIKLRESKIIKQHQKRMEMLKKLKENIHKEAMESIKKKYNL